MIYMAWVRADLCRIRWYVLFPATVYEGVDAEGFGSCGLFDRLQYAWRGVNEGRVFEVSDDDEFVVFGLGVHVVEGLDVVWLENMVLRIVEVLFAEDLFCKILFY